jgi:hypothetical protein
MKIFDLALNAAVIVSATLFLAYIGAYYFDFGLFTTLPDGISGFFLRNGALQYVALGLLIGALAAKIPVGRALKRQDTRKRI